MFDPIIIHLCDHTRPSYPLVMFYEDLNHNVLKLDIHDGGHRLLLWAEQSRPEDHAQVGDRHQIVLIVTGHAVGRRERRASFMSTMGSAESALLARSTLAAVVTARVRG